MTVRATHGGLAIATSKATRPKPRPSPDATNAPGADVIGEPAKTLPPRAGSKLARVIDLLERSEGVTVLHLMEATGWLPHKGSGSRIGARHEIDR
jgi:hypothetical protein